MNGLRPGEMANRPNVPFAVRQQELTYEPLPLNTHPIDVAYGPQGWGPFNGPWTPWDFPDPAMFMAQAGIDDTWLQGDNRVTYSPPYDLLTLHVDNSTEWVNAQLQRANAADESTRVYTSTIGNANPGVTNGKTPPNTFVGRVKQLLNGGD